MTTIVPAATEEQGYCHRSTWSLLTATTTGDPVKVSGAADKSVQVTGIGATGCTVVLEGSNEAVAVNYFPLTDPTGTAIAFTADGGKQIVEECVWVRARLSVAGTAAVPVVTLIARRTH